MGFWVILADVQILLGFIQPFLQVVNGFYRRGVSLVEYCQIVACPVAQVNQAHHLAELAVTLAVHKLVADGVLLQEVSGYLVANQNSRMK